MTHSRTKLYRTSERKPPPPRSCEECKTRMIWIWDGSHGLTGEFICRNYPRCGDAQTPGRNS